jgi:hypothetical protein
MDGKKRDIGLNLALRARLVVADLQFRILVHHQNSDGSSRFRDEKLCRY